MNIYIYSDESGVFDREHNDIFCFSGVIFLSKNSKDNNIRKYRHAEKIIRERENKTSSDEVKATTISNTNKGKLYRSLNQVEKFGVIVYQQEIHERIFDDKKSKQRYLDYAYKIGIKRKFESLINSGDINPNDVDNLIFYVDEHTTATNGRYELREALEQEFKHGTFNWNYSIHFPALFPNLSSVELKFCDSSRVALVRAADIVANKLFHRAISNELKPKVNSNFNITVLPHEQVWKI